MGELVAGIIVIYLIGMFAFAMIAGWRQDKARKRRWGEKAADPRSCAMCGGLGWREKRDPAGRPVYGRPVEGGPNETEGCPMCGGSGIEPTGRIDGAGPANHIPSRETPGRPTEAAQRLFALSDRPVQDWQECPLCQGGLTLPVPGVAWCERDERAFTPPGCDIEATDERDPRITGVRDRFLLLNDISEHLDRVPVVSMLRPPTMYSPRGGFSPPPVVRDLEVMRKSASFAEDK